MQLNSVVKASDVVNVTGHKECLFPKKEVTKSKDSLKMAASRERRHRNQPYVYSNAVSFLSTWMPSEVLTSEETPVRIPFLFRSAIL